MTFAQASAASVTLPSDPTDPLANPPRVDNDPLSAPERTRIDAAQARPRLKTLPRYHNWQTAKQRYDTHIGLMPNGHVGILFSPPLVTDQQVSMDVDVAAQTVKVSLGVG